eukprot:CAMPEP_0176107978 /NCGR_PEP_ID=MMETSP0120_2-20121206/54196_1 /TAXON_ID=160619 /ORGANISM="Kryptoperidinium foliaceum, Strain CCMP 1326" /LENGTH=133 /DNA_ID=CAMNT_0017442125 /DNA_START=30 /DNA_END=427 /DNA_ORIENTATION=-
MCLLSFSHLLAQRRCLDVKKPQKSHGSPELTQLWAWIDGNCAACDCPALEPLRGRFLEFCDPGESSLTEAQFAALLGRYHCCSPAASSGFFHTFVEAGDRMRPQLDAAEGTSSHCKPLLNFHDFVVGVCLVDP